MLSRANRSVSSPLMPEPEATAVRLEGVSKSFQLYRKPHHRLLQGLFRGRKQYFTEFWALRDITFEVHKGETLGIIGRNGAGKSTLLEIMSGTLAQNTGTVEIDGRVAAILGLGAGFSPDFTGRENVHMLASVLGLGKTDLDDRFEDIAAFAEIGDFMDQPVKTYSNGMVMRLAFAVMVNVDADILIVDEALAVGDIYFAQKCVRFFEKFQQSGTLLLVSHDMATIQSLCSSAVWLDNGRICASGDVDSVTKAYLESFYAKKATELTENRRFRDGAGGSRGADEAPPPGSRKIVSGREWITRSRVQVGAFDQNAASFGEGGAEIWNAGFFSENEVPLREIFGGEDVAFVVKARVSAKMESPAIGFVVKNKAGRIVYDLSTYYPLKHKDLSFSPGTAVTVRFRYRLPVLAKGEYLMSLAIAEGDAFDHVQLHWIHDAVKLSVVAGPFMQGDMWVSDPVIELVVEQ